MAELDFYPPPAAGGGGGGGAAAAVPVVAALPANPVDGQECYYLASAANGVVWHLKYRAASASAYKWEFVGGPSLRDVVMAQESITSAAYTDLTTVGPSITPPLAGDYDVTIGAQIGWAAWGTGFISYAVGAAPATDEDSAKIAVASGIAGTVQSTRRKTAIAAGTLIRAKIRNGQAGQAPTFEARTLLVAPVRVG